MLLPFQQQQFIILFLIIRLFLSEGQSYREAGLLDDSRRTFDRAISFITKSPSDFTYSWNDFAKGLSQLDPSFQSIVVWTASNLYAVKGLLCHWKYFEELEYFLENIVNNEKIFQKSLQFGIGTHFIDPYTFSLNRFASYYSDRRVCELACDYSISNVKSWMRRDLAQKKIISKLRVGYLSYDW